MHLDMRSVMISQTLIGAVCALVMTLLWRHARKRYEGLGYLAANFVLLLAGAALIALRGLIPDFISIFIANTLSMLGQYFFCRGMALFVGKPWSGRLELAAVGVFSVLFFYFSAVSPELPARNLLITGFYSLFCARAAWLLLHGVSRELKAISMLLSGSLAGFILVSLLRLGFTVFGQPAQDFLANHPYDTFLIVSYSGLLVSLTFGVYLMVNRRLMADTLSDISRRVKAEASLLENAGSLQLALDSAGMGAWKWDIKRDFRSFDERTCSLLGLRADSFKGTGKEFMAVVHPEDRLAIKAAMARTLDSDVTYSPEYRAVWPDGTVRHLAAKGRLRRDREGKPDQLDGLLWDITERKRVEAELLASKERFIRAFHAAPMLMSLSEIETGRFIEVNDKFCEVTGFSREELIGKTSVEVGWITAEARRELLRVAGGKNLRVPELELRAKGGRPVVCSYSCDKINLGEREILLAIAEDITVVKEAEAAKRAAQKLESLGTLAGGIAHDFNNLLTGITGNLSLLRRGSGGETEELVKEAETACQTARGLARQLLTFASGGEPVKTPLDMAALAAESVSFSLRGSAVKGQAESSGGPVCVLGDREQLFQVVHNLAVNAAQAMPAGGSIAVITGRAKLSAGEVPPLPEGEYCSVSVRDTGHGIPPELLGSIFDPYFSTKGKGRGLGLSVCRSIVNKHGGQIAVRSAQGKGSVFTVYLPLTGEVPAGAAQPEAPAKPGGGRVLVMDDEEIVYKALRRMLEALGYEVEVTVHGEAALEAWRKAAQAGRPFAAAIMDLTISGGMGGAEAVKRLKGFDPKAKVIVSSGYSDGHIMADYAAHGFDASLGKPYQIEELAEVLGKVLA